MNNKRLYFRENRNCRFLWVSNLGKKSDFETRYFPKVLVQKQKLCMPVYNSKKRRYDGKKAMM